MATKKKTATKKAAPKKSTATKKKIPTKKKAAAPSNGSGQFGVERKSDLPWNDKKVAVFKALKSLGCTSAATGRPAKEISEKAGVTQRDVRHYVYHAKAADLTDVAEIEGTRGYVFYLTKKGAAVDPVKEAKKGATS